VEGALTRHYRIYKLDRPGGRIIKGKDKIAPDDEAALSEAEKDKDCPLCEVWRGAKRIGKV
jgi:hypothetical protein